jgi:RNA polymerase sigma-70 factor (ECF subfamily)
MSSAEAPGRPRSDGGAADDDREHGEGLTHQGQDEDAAAREPDPDQDVVELVRASKVDAALRTLMKRHGDAVYRYCRESLRDASLAEDVQQRVFIEVHRDLRRYEGRSTLRSWLFGIVRHRVLDAAKARRRRETPLDRREQSDVPDSSPTVGERLDGARLSHALLRCLEDVGEHVREALLLRYQQGLTFDEMAEVCGEKAGTLQARVSRALPLLRDCIQRRTRGSS